MIEGLFWQRKEWFHSSFICIFITCNYNLYLQHVLTSYFSKQIPKFWCSHNPSLMSDQEVHEEQPLRKRAAKGSSSRKSQQHECQWKREDIKLDPLPPFRHPPPLCQLTNWVHKSPMRARRWYMKLFGYSLDLWVRNALLLYKRNSISLNEKVMTLRWYWLWENTDHLKAIN